MDTRYTNREKFLDGISNCKLSIYIHDTVTIESSCEYCPLNNTECKYDVFCEDKIEKWLGECSN